MIYEQLTLDCLPSTESDNRQSSPQGSPVSLTALQEKVAAIVTSVTCGGKLRECLEKLNRVGSSVKIRPVYSQEAISGFSAGCSTTLPRWGILSVGECGELVMSAPRTEEKEYPLWLGTPTASMTKRSKKFKRKTLTPAEFVEKFPTPTASRHDDCPSERRRHTPSLDAYVNMFPTPTVCGNYNKKEQAKRPGMDLRQ